MGEGSAIGIRLAFQSHRCSGRGGTGKRPVEPMAAGVRPSPLLAPALGYRRLAAQRKLLGKIGGEMALSLDNLSISLGPNGADSKVLKSV